MEGFFDKCMFCGTSLPARDNRGEGDHIIPKFIYGSIRFKDICSNCNNTFGSEVDHKILEDPKIISSIWELNLPKLRRDLLDRGETVMIDNYSQVEMRAKTKKGIPKIIRQEIEGGIIANDDDGALQEIERKMNKASDSNKKFQEIREKHSLLNPGQVLDIPELGIMLRKSTAKAEHRFKEDFHAGHRLISKIVWEASLIFFLPHRLLSVLDDLEKFYNCAMYNEKLPPYAIMHPPYFDPNKYDPKKADYFHRIVAFFEEGFNAIDLTFFGNVHYRVLLRPSDSEHSGPQEDANGEKLRMFGFVMCFKPGAERKKYIGKLVLNARREKWCEASWL